jgi:predicted PurR-regulated permease PerM
MLKPGNNHKPNKGVRFTLPDADWPRYRDVALALLSWIALLVVVLYLLSFIARPILIALIAAILAYALAPAVDLLHRVMPRWLAIAIVYLVFLGVIGTLGYFVIVTAINQFVALSGEVKYLVTPGAHGVAPLVAALHRLGLTDQQINGAVNQLAGTLSGLTASIVPFLVGFFNTLLDIIVVGVVSVYLMIDGPRLRDWSQRHAPVQMRATVVFLADALERVVGGYIRGQLALSGLIGVLVGVGMAIFQVHFAVLLGVMAFVLEFIPIVGTLVSGAICVLIAFGQDWRLAIGVLIYFIVVHVIEGDLVGPRIVGRAIGLHPAVSIVALIAGADLFGIWGALFAAPVAGLLQALLVGFWQGWKAAHPEDFGIEREESEPSAEEDSIPGGETEAGVTSEER